MHAGTTRRAITATVLVLGGAASLAGCGGKAANSGSRTVYLDTGSGPTVGLPNLFSGEVKPGPPLVARPFSVSCVLRSFRRAGAELLNANGPDARRKGVAILLPVGDINVDVYVWRTQDVAADQLGSMRVGMLFGAPSRPIVVKDHNVVIAYGLGAAELVRVPKARRLLRDCKS